METAKIICVIDDDVAFQKMMTHHLSALGFAVRSLFSASEVDTLKERPHAILLDHYLDNEKTTGLHLLKKLKKKMPEVPVIYMTSETDRSVREAALKSGVFDFIGKGAASLVNLRTSLDRISQGAHKKNWFSRILG